jgi:hypothetical protein
VIRSCIRLRTTVSGLVLILVVLGQHLALVGANRQSNRRNTVSGRMTLRYSLRL